MASSSGSSRASPSARLKTSRRMCRRTGWRHRIRCRQAAGASRAVWDLRYAPPPALRHDYPISATAGQTPQTPEGPLAAPGKYDVRLDGQRADRSSAAHDHLRSARARRAGRFRSAGRVRAPDRGRDGARRTRTTNRSSRFEKPRPRDTQDVDALKAFDRSAAALIGEQPRGGTGSPNARPPADFASLNGNLSALLEASDLADGAPTDAMKAAWAGYCRELETRRLAGASLRRRISPRLNVAASPSCTP